VPLPSAEHVARIAQCGSLDEKK
jgi:hypothetical protein